MAKKQPTISKRTPRPSPPAPVDPGAGPNVIDQIFSDAGDSPPPSLKKIEQRSDRRVTKILLLTLGALALLVGITVAGFMTFNRQKHFNEQGVSLKVETDESVPSGGLTLLTFVIKNDESVGIKNLTLSLTPPEGWTFSASTPKPSDASNSLWQLGSISAKDSKNFVVQGILVGEVGSVKSFSATLTYRPSNFNYDFTAKASVSATIGSSIISLELDGPSQVAPDVNTHYALTYTNTSTEDLTGVRFIATYPSEFSVTSTNPSARQDNNVWTVDELKSGTKGTITVDGKFKGEVGSSVELTFAAELKRGTSFEKQVETAVVVTLANTSLNLTLTVNKQSGKAVAAPGDLLAYVLTYKNTSDVELSATSISVELTGGGLASGSFTDDLGATLKDGKVSWDVNRIPQLASIKPGTTGTLRFQAKVSSTPATTSGDSGPTVMAQATVTLGSNSSTNTNSVSKNTNANAASPTVKTGRLVTKISSQVVLAADPRYYRSDGTTVGSGPLPPQAGKTTTYRVSWSVTNGTNEVGNVTVKAVVPTAVFWTGKNSSTTAGTLSFDPSTRTVTWSINKLPARIGTSGAAPTASFELALTPTDDDIGLTPTILGDSTLSGTDTFTGTTITVERDRLTTDLPNDAKASGKGVVVAG